MIDPAKTWVEVFDHAITNLPAILGAVFAGVAVLYAELAKKERVTLARTVENQKEELAAKVESQKNDLTAVVVSQNAAVAAKVDIGIEKLTANTELTKVGAATAAQAFTAANDFNARQLRVEKAMGDLRKDVSEELNRMSQNLHRLNNTLTPLIGSIDWVSRKRGEE